MEIVYFSPEDAKQGRISQQNIRDIARLKIFYNTKTDVDDISEETISRVYSQIIYGEHIWLAQTRSIGKGLIFGEFQSEQWFISNGVFVHPNERRNGIAYTLKQAQIETLRGFSNCFGIKTSISPSNKESLGLSRKCGFEIGYAGGQYQRAIYHLK